MFIKCKRASKVLANEGLRKRYDFFGLDCGIDDCATEDEKGANNQKEEDEADDSSNTATSNIRRISVEATSFITGLIFRSFLAYFFLLVLRFKIFGIATTFTAWFFIFKASPSSFVKEWDFSVKGGVAAALPVALFLIWWSGPGGWFWLIIETAVLFLVFSYYFISNEIYNKLLLAGIGICTFFIAWFFQSCFKPYFFMLFAEGIFGLVLLLFFPLSEYLVQETVNDMLKIYSSKIREALENERVGMEKKYKNGGGKNSSVGLD